MKTKQLQCKCIENGKDSIETCKQVKNVYVQIVVRKKTMEGIFISTITCHIQNVLTDTSSWKQFLGLVFKRWNTNLQE